MADTVGRYITLKRLIKEQSEELAALELIILNELRDDDRITITAPRKTIEIKEETYAKLDIMGIETHLLVPKKLKDFDEKTQHLILASTDNYTEKLSKESIRIKEGK